MAVALGLSKESEPYPNTSALAPYLRGNVGLLFSPRTPTEIVTYFESFQPEDYARSGSVASRDFTIPAGTVYSRAGEILQEDDVPLAHSIEPTLRKLGVPSKLVKGRIELENDYTVCRAGEVLGSGQTNLLKMFGIATARFVVELQACYEQQTNSVKSLGASQDMSRRRLENEDMEINDLEGF